MTIGLYDIDFNHGHSFSLSLPLMKAYTKFYNQGHQVIMMKPYEKTGRYTKIFYFKDNPKLIVPKGIVFGEKSSLHGYGFYKEARISKETAALPPSFEPYDFNSSKIKKLKLYNSIKQNNFIDWREKDFTYSFSGKAFTYINDRDFLEEEDWKELFNNYSNNIEFIHSLHSNNFEQVEELLKVYYGKQKIIVPFTLEKEKLLRFSSIKNVVFSPQNDDELLLLIFAAKILTDNKIEIPINFYYGTDYEKNLVQWAGGDRISFKSFMGKDFNDRNYLKIKNRLLLKQNPKTISYEDFKTTFLTF